MHVCCVVFFFFFKQKTAYELRISDWSSDVCSSDLPAVLASHASVSSGGAGAPDAGQWQAWMLDWLWPAGQASHAGPERPLRAMRTILGTPFAPLTRGQAATQLGFGVLAMADRKSTRLNSSH